MVVIGLAARKTEGMERVFEDIIDSLEQSSPTIVSHGPVYRMTFRRRELHTSHCRLPGNSSSSFKLKLKGSTVLTPSLLQPELGSYPTPMFYGKITPSVPNHIDEIQHVMDNMNRTKGNAYKVNLEYSPLVKGNRENQGISRDLKAS
ncbi:hypothetical protein NC653_032503 [Populus alba x Populus x berolinensis]|uniref:Uncharacterized protein n=1 Tax=Populus alba x Populus x berolinensis TaxID=444605 RepID=A0AAD6LRH8_9ROSI|nr:hypothetical protein NC653_032503 [Populus alba x Populus x berolinensis]